MANSQPYNKDGIWYHSDGSAYMNQQLAASNTQFRFESDELRQAHLAENEVVNDQTLVEHNTNRERATIEVYIR